jgi:F-type H+-transporting ATPase subunit epsilon
MAVTSSSEPIQLVVLTPSRKILDVRCRDVSFPSALGRLQILPGHAELICQLGTGVMYFSEGNSVGVAAISGGVANVAENCVTILADIAEEASQIDPTRAQKALERAQSRMAGKVIEADIGRASRSEEKARARLDAAQLKSQK